MTRSLSASSLSFVITCGPSKLDNRGAGGGLDREHIVSRPSVIGAVPLYYLLKAGRELRAHLPNAPPHLQDDAKSISHVPPSDYPAIDTLREAADAAVEEMALKDAEISLLKKRCRELERALVDSRKSAITTSTSTIAIADTPTITIPPAPKLGRELNSAYLQRIQAERLAERLQLDVSKLETGIAERDGDAVKMNIMTGMLAIVALTCWIQSGGGVSI